MSMFDLVFHDPGRADRIGALLALLAFDQESPEKAEEYATPILNLRIRDAWVERQPDGPPVLAVYTRNGGGNRECHCEGTGQENDCTGCRGEKATWHPAYLRDADDEFDSTYRTYWFSFPASLPSDYKQALTDAAETPRNMSEIWQQAIDALGGAR